MTTRNEAKQALWAASKKNDAARAFLTEFLATKSTDAPGGGPGLVDDDDLKAALKKVGGCQVTAISFREPESKIGNHWLYETIAITDQATDSVAVVRAIGVPEWAETATFVLDITITGTTPLFDLKFEGAPRNSVDTTSLWPLSDWNGITQLTTDESSPTVAIDVGPGITGIADDDTGSATASCRYALNTPLPGVIVYTYTTDGTTDDEDYNGTLSVTWRGRR